MRRLALYVSSNIDLRGDKLQSVRKRGGRQGVSVAGSSSHSRPTWSTDLVIEGAVDLVELCSVDAGQEGGHDGG